MEAMETDKVQEEDAGMNNVAAPDSVKKSMLNPNAKEFSPPRLQTPNIPNSNNMAVMAQTQGIQQVRLKTVNFKIVISFVYRLSVKVT